MPETLTAYLVSSHGDRAITIKRLLEEQGVVVYDAFSFEPGDDISKTIVDRIQSADFVVVYISSPTSSVYYEAGIAVGSGKPIAAISEGDTLLPAPLARSVSIRSSLKDTTIVRAFLRRFAQGIQSQRTTTSEPAAINEMHPKKHDETVFSDLLERARQLRAPGCSRELNLLVFDLLDRLQLVHARSTTMAPESDRGVDAVVWSDVLAPSLGTPLLIEVKARCPKEGEVDRARRTIEYYLDQTGARTALFLYLDSSGRRIPPYPGMGPNVLAFDLEDLLTELQAAPLESILLSARSRLSKSDVS